MGGIWLTIKMYVLIKDLCINECSCTILDAPTHDDNFAIYASKICWSSSANRDGGKGKVLMKQLGSVTSAGWMGC